MALFGGKKRDEDEDLEDEDVLDQDDSDNESSERRSKFKKFRDLKPENRKKRAEPAKPWGIRERLLVFGVIAVTVLLSIAASLSGRDWKWPGLPRLTIPKITLPDFSAINPFGEKTIIVGNPSAVPSSIPTPKVDLEALGKKKLAEFKPLYESITKNLSGTYGVYVIELDSGVSYGNYSDEIFPAASVIKLPVIITLFAEGEKGTVNVDEKFALKASDKLGYPGSIQKLPVGSQISLRDLARFMGHESDNAAFMMVRKKLGDATINEKISEMGLVNTSLKDNETTPKEVAVMFQKFWDGELVNEANRKEILADLTDTIYEMWIPEGIPERVIVAHKVGFDLEAHIKNDAGIVLAKKPFIIVILSKGIVGAEADKAMVELTKAVYGLVK